MQSSIFAINTDLNVKFLVSTQGFFISIRGGKYSSKQSSHFIPMMRENSVRGEISGPERVQLKTHTSSLS